MWILSVSYFFDSKREIFLLIHSLYYFRWQIKQEAMRLYAQLHEAEARLDQLMAETANHEDPGQERERLLKQVREDNQEMASMERQ